jgi:hypothetical protein
MVRAILRLLSSTLPVCMNHPEKLATVERWRIHYCDECNAKLDPKGADHKYATAVRDLEGMIDE